LGIVRRGSGYLHGTVVVAVALMRVVQVPVDDVIGVVSVRDGDMAAITSVGVLFAVALTIVGRRAFRRIFPSHTELVLVDVVAVNVVEMTVVRVIDVPVVLDFLMPAVRAVGVVVLVVFLVVVVHGSFSSRGSSVGLSWLSWLCSAACSMALSMRSLTCASAKE
jgi:hypothetical protein